MNLDATEIKVLDAPRTDNGELTTMRREAELSQLPAQIWGKYA